ncbi:MAG: DciA family protein [Patescibacteria group bacterium]|jgi:hypothetical protein
MKKIGEFIFSSMAKKGLIKETVGAQICFYAESWGKYPFRSVSFSRGILKVSVTSSSAAQELQMKEEEIIEYLNKKIGRKIVKGVRIVNNS